MKAVPGARLSFLRLPLLPTGLGFVLVGGTIAAMAPFDVAFGSAPSLQRVYRRARLRLVRPA
jgi:hypothetical protein